MKKKFISIGLVLLMVFAQIPSAYAAETRQNAEVPVLKATVRDFRSDGILFQGPGGAAKGLVRNTLNSDRKPEFILEEWQNNYGSVTEDMMDSMYNDAPGINMSTDYEIKLKSDGNGYYEMDSDYDNEGNYAGGYFPIDDRLLGNEGNNHNFFFTTEIHSGFYYEPGNRMTFTGDDDVWIFLNGRLCVDLGGLHEAMTDTIDVDDLIKSGVISAEPGDFIRMDMFHMERHKYESNFKMKTNIEFNSKDDGSEPDAPVIKPQVKPVPSDCEVYFKANVRDFKDDGILFEGGNSGHVKGLVNDRLGRDRKPDFNLAKWKNQYGDITQSRIDAMYTDRPGLNAGTEWNIPLKTKGDGFYEMNSDYDWNGNYIGGYFPIDNVLFGNEGRSHNYGFTTEIHSGFYYYPGAEMTFTGDDDVWIFIDGKLCVDLGGLHPAMSETIKLDDLVKNGTLDIKQGEYVRMDMFHMERHTYESNFKMRTNIKFYADPENPEPPKPVNPDVPGSLGHHSSWAEAGLKDAADKKLIPGVLMNKDLTKNITRAEFAAVSVKLYEKLSGKAAPAAGKSPFTDTADPDVIKAAALGIVNGVGNGKFAPSGYLTREQASVMLTRAYFKGASKTNVTLPAYKPFADHAKISKYAVDSVYFMAHFDVLNGVGNNMFAPQSNASREQAIIISIRVLNNINI